MLTISRQAPARVHYGMIEAGAPLPLMIGLTEGGVLCRVHFAPKGKAQSAAILRQWQREWPRADFVLHNAAVRAWWGQWGGPHKGGKPAFPVLLVGTAFQGRVWRALASVPCGTTLTYGELAQKIGKAGAARAVGTALGKNPVPFFIPCHRIVAASGLGGFTGGLKVKRTLLQKEGTPYQ